MQFEEPPENLQPKTKNLRKVENESTWNQPEPSQPTTISWTNRHNQSTQSNLHVPNVHQKKSRHLKLFALAHDSSARGFFPWGQLYSPLWSKARTQFQRIPGTRSGFFFGGEMFQREAECWIPKHPKLRGGYLGCQKSQIEKMIVWNSWIRFDEIGFHRLEIVKDFTEYCWFIIVKSPQQERISD